jgi:hypothetical protein
MHGRDGRTLYASGNTCDKSGTLKKNRKGLADAPGQA